MTPWRNRDFLEPQKCRILRGNLLLLTEAFRIRDQNNAHDHKKYSAVPSAQSIRKHEYNGRNKEAENAKDQISFMQNDLLDCSSDNHMVE